MTVFKQVSQALCYWSAKWIAPPQTHAIGWANVVRLVEMQIITQSHSVYTFYENKLHKSYLLLSPHVKLG